LIETACLPNHLQCFRRLPWEYFDNHAAAAKINPKDLWAGNIRISCSMSQLKSLKNVGMAEAINYRNLSLGG
jgi:hypothetical protein